VADNPFADLLKAPAQGTAPAQQDNPFAALLAGPRVAAPANQAAATSGADTYDLAEVPSAAWKNLPANAKQKLTGLYESVFGHPLETAKGLAQLANTLVNPIEQAKDWYKAFNIKPDEQGGHRLELSDEPSLTGGMLKEIVNRYGSWDKAKTTAAEDPLGFLMDVTGLIPSPASGAGRAAKVAGTAAELLDPARVAMAAPRVAAESAGKGVAKIAQLLSQSEHGTAAGALSELFESGKQVTPGVWKALTEGLDTEKLRGQFGDILSQKYEDRRDAYLRGMNLVEGNDRVIPFAKIDKAVGDAGGIGIYKAPKDTKPGPGYNFEKDESVKAARAEILAEIERFRAMGPEYHTAAGFDKLKQAVQQIGENLEKDGLPSRGSAFAGKIADSIVKTVSSEVPEYGKIMRGYHDDTKEIKTLLKEFSAGKNANPLTTLRKLQSVWRNHANSGYGARADLLKDVAQSTGNADMLAQLAAHEYHPWAPRGLRGVGFGLADAGTLGMTLVNPAVGLPLLGATAASHAAASPRIAGMAAYGAGRVSPYAAPVGRAYRSLEKAAPWLMRADRWNPQNEEEPQRKRGGFFGGVR
jgi:hypothetical protein